MTAQKAENRSETYVEIDYTGIVHAPDGDFDLSTSSTPIAILACNRIPIKRDPKRWSRTPRAHKFRGYCPLNPPFSEGISN